MNGPVASIGASLLTNGGTLNLSAGVSASGFAIPTVQAGGTVSLGAHNLAATTLSVAGTLSGTGTVTVSGLLTLSGTLSGAGTVDAMGGMTIRTSALSALDGTTLTNSAGETATWVGGNLTFDDGAVFNNEGTFSIPAPAAGSLAFASYWQEGTGAPSSFNNSGSLIDSSGAAAGNCFFNLPFNTSGGTVDVKSGSLDLVAGGTSTGGTFTTESGTELDFGAACRRTWTLDSNSSIGGAGTVNFEGAGTFTMNGTYDVTGTTSGTGVTIGMARPAGQLRRPGRLDRLFADRERNLPQFQQPLRRYRVRSEAWRSSNGH